MTLDFSNGHISGSASDPVGAYHWTGTYDTKAETCQLSKTYVGAHSVEYSGYADENGIWGKWTIKRWRSGEFHIWPKKMGSAEGNEENKRNALVITTSLLYMKVCVLVFFLVLGISSFAQTTAPQAAPPSTFFAKGQEWQYVNFVAKKGVFGKRNGYIESTRFGYKVTGVTDSNGVIYSTILKTGTAVNDNYSWHRNFVVRGDQGVLSLPADYYLIDTVFLCDVYGNWPKPAVYSDLHATGDSLQYPLGADTSSQLKSSGYVMDINLFDPQRAEGMKTVGFVGTSRNIHYKGISAKITRRFVGSARITTEAGTFDCYQYHVEADMESGPVRKQVLDEYYNPAVGIVKTEDTRGTYMELVRVKKKK